MTKKDQTIKEAQEEFKDNQEKKPEDNKPGDNKKGKNKPVDEKVYADFVNLKFLKLGGATLKPEAEEKLKELEKEVKSCSGAKAKQSVTAYVGKETLKLVEGYPMPERFEKIIKETKVAKHYI